ncbi:MAG: hypothetical protein ACP5K5_01870 [Candidatus Micrarchaeia archaeon]
MLWIAKGIFLFGDMVGLLLVESSATALLLSQNKKACITKRILSSGIMLILCSISAYMILGGAK